MIEIQNLTKNYGDRTVLDHLSFSLKKGEVMGFLGPNGAGKTTTMRILTGYMPASEGTANIAGWDVFTHPHEVKKRIGYLPETPPLYPEMTVESYLRFAAGLKGVERNRVATAVAGAVDRCGLGEVRRRLVRHLSKGYRQRVGLAQAVINSPEVLIMDEPTSGLDPKQIVEIRGLIADLSESQTIILSTHILPEVMAICSRVLIIHRGRKVADDTYADLTQVQAGRREFRLATARADAAQVEGLKAIPGVERVESLGGGTTHGFRIRTRAEDGDAAPQRIAQYVVERRMGLIEITPLAGGLEEIFIRRISESEKES